MTYKYQYYLLLRKAPQVTLTVSPTPSDAVVKLNGSTQNSITVCAGDSVKIEVSKSGYKTIVANAIVQEDYTYQPTLTTSCKVTVTSLISGATISISDTVNNGVQTDDTAILTTDAGSTVTITMSKTGYTTKTETISNISKDRTYIWELHKAASS